MTPTGETHFRPRLSSRDSGMVTAELAATMPALVLMLTVALGAVSAVTTQLRSEHAACMAARAVARGEHPAGSMPRAAQLTVVTEAGMVRATVQAHMRLGGAALPVIQISAVCVAAAEAGEEGKEDREGKAPP